MGLSKNVAHWGVVRVLHLRPVDADVLGLYVRLINDDENSAHGERKDIACVSFFFLQSGPP